MNWRCARCNWVGIPPLKDFGKLGTAHVCAKCGTEDVFEDIPEEWEEARRENERYRHLLADDSE